MKNSTPQGDTENTLMGIYHEILAMGNNDSEHDAFKDILSKYKTGVYTREVAIEKATAIKESKQR